jgi:PAS domain S-box-containing protein
LDVIRRALLVTLAVVLLTGLILWALPDWLFYPTLEGVAIASAGAAAVGLTLHRRSERRAEQAEQRYRSLVEGLPSAVYLAEFGEEGRWLYVSPQIERMLGYPASRWTQDPRMWVDHIHPGDRELALRHEQDIQRTGDRLRCEYRLRRDDGSYLWVRDEAEVVPVKTGRPSLMQGVLADITEQRAAQEAMREAFDREREAARHLRELDELKTGFLQAVSHDLRTPLTTILGVALTLERNEGRISQEDAQDLLRRAAKNARKLHRLVDDLLDVERISHGVAAPTRRPVSLQETIDNAVDGMPTEGRALEIRVPAGTASLDGPKVERIVENLVSNALRYTPPGTPIWIDVTRTSEGVLVVVEDAGPGVPEALRESIFEPFRQGTELVDHSPGVGIGLAVVDRFARLHGGRAWVEERAGGGASFRVLLPEENVPAGASLPPDGQVPSERSPEGSPGHASVAMARPAS